MSGSSSLALLTDLYQLTMAYGYWKSGMKDHEAVFHLFFRKNPFRGGYAIACGLHTVIEFLEAFRFEQEDLEYLAGLTGNDGKALFERDFLDYLGTLSMDFSVKALPEGTAVFPHEPLLQMRGSIILCQLLETPLLNLINFQTLIATKAARICSIAGDEPVLEFGLRRAQGVDGGISASRAAYVGGCAATSHVLAGKRFDIPVRGTHAHSWVMAFDSERESFEAYAAAMPNNCIFLVDTYDSIKGVKQAIEVGRSLRNSGHNMVGIRLDSGNLAQLSIEARKLLDIAGFESAVIVASNDLDEYRMQALHEAGAEIKVWGIGTRLATAYDQPALGGVYKLAAIKAPGEDWESRIKLSEDPIKVSQPGILQVRRFWENGKIVADMMYEAETDPAGERLLSLDGHEIPYPPAESEELLIPIFSNGELVYLIPNIHASRGRTLQQLEALPDACRSITDAGQYLVGLSGSLYKKKMQMIELLD